MIKNQQQFNIELNPESTDIIVFGVPSMESVKKLNSAIHLLDNAKEAVRREAEKESSRPYVIAAVGKGVKDGYLKVGDMVWMNPDSLGASTVIRFSAEAFWKNPIVVPSFYAFKVTYTEEYEKEFDAIIDWYNEEQVKKEQILANA